MSDIYITGGGETLQEIIKAHYGPLSNTDFKYWQNLVIEANLMLNDSSVLKPSQLLFLPNSQDNLICTQERAQIQDTWNELGHIGKKTLFEGLRRNHPGFWEELNELLIEYEILSTTGYVNTFAAGATGGVTARASQLAFTLTKVETVLQEYANSNSSSRAMLKPKVRAAYHAMNNAFSNDLKATSAKLKASGRLGPLKSPRQGMQRATILAQKGSKSTVLGKTGEALRIIKLAKYGKFLGNGMIVLDLGIRVHNVTNSDNKLRTGVSEGTGFAASFGAGAIVYSKCLAPAAAFTGPWSLAICLLPAGGAALLADEVGKFTGTTTYDALTK